jgi:hypothetical protein
VSRVERTSEGRLMFECPGCGLGHAVAVRPATLDNGHSWDWNGSLERPTFSPSINAAWEQHGQPQRCHSFVANGRIQFLGDCTHALAGQTVDLPEIES